MSIISRLEGSPLSTTSAPTIITHLTTIVIPRVTPYFNRIRAENATRLADRRLREEQARACEAAGKGDTERVLRKRAEEEAKRQAIESASRDAAAEREREQRLARLVQLGREWRAWKRSTMPSEPAVGEPGTTRISVRLGDGRQAVRRFREDETIEDIYTLVECSLDPEESTSPLVSASPPRGYTHIYEFQLASTLPRTLLNVEGSAGKKTIRQVGGLVPSANLIVEGLAARRVSMGTSNADSDEEEIEEDE